MRKSNPNNNNQPDLLTQTTAAYYQAPIDLLPTFTYGQWSGLETITHLGDLDGQRYFHVGEGVPLPTSPKAAFTPVELTDVLADKLRANASAFVLPLLETQNQKTIKAKSEIDLEREHRLNAGFDWKDNTYPSDETFLNVLLSMAVAYQAELLTGTQSVRLKNNSVISLGQEAITDLLAALTDYRQSVYTWAWAAKDAVENGLSKY
jgi:hypothetical protein